MRAHGRPTFSRASRGGNELSKKWEEFLGYLGELADLSGAVHVLGWDQQTYMPSSGVETRATQLATLERHIHQLFVREEMGNLLAHLEKEMAGLPYDSFEASILRLTRREYDRATRVPARLVREMAHATAIAFDAWSKAKAISNFASFRPHLEHLQELQLEHATALGYDETPYDALLSIYEPDLTSKQVGELFAQLRDRLVPLVAAIQERLNMADDGPLRQYFPETGQWQLSQRVLDLMGFNTKQGRLDKAEHPFTTSFSPRDVRLTTNIRPNHLASSLFSTMHEAGHGLYEQGIPWKYHRTPLGTSVTLSVHESQSRLWENLVGRSRLFWQHFMPVVREVFPSQLSGMNVDRLYRAANRVEPSLIRVDADEVTYNLHIFIRFELEQDLIAGRLAVKDLPDAWNSKYESYLGVTPSDDARGVLQDVHWASGLFGYFPTYALGNVLSVQIWDTMQQDGEISYQLKKGRFSAIKTWLNKNVYVYGAKFTTQELAKRVTGSPLVVEPYLRYIEGKFREIYAL